MNNGARVTYSNGTVLETSINGTDEEVKAFFLPGKWFNVGDGPNDLMAQVVKVEII